MEEKDLKGLWNQSGEEAINYYSGIEPEVIKKSQANSHDILSRVRKNIIWELILSGIVTVVFPFLLLDDMLVFWIGTSVLVLAMVFSLKVYLGYLSKIKEVNEDSVIAGLEKKIGVLSGYIRRLKILIYVFSILGFLFGLVLGAFLNENDFIAEIASRKILIQLAVGIPFMAAFLWFCHKYIYWLYGKNLIRLKKVLDGLKADA